MLKFDSFVNINDMLLLSQNPKSKLVSGLFDLLVKNKNQLFHFIDVNKKITYDEFTEKLKYKFSAHNLYLYALYGEEKDSLKAVFEVKYSYCDNSALIRWFVGELAPNPKLLSKALKDIVKQLSSLGCRKTFIYINPLQQYDINICTKSGFNLEAILQKHEFDYNIESFIDIAVFSKFNEI